MRPAVHATVSGLCGALNEADANARATSACLGGQRHGCAPESSACLLEVVDCFTPSAAAWPALSLDLPQLLTNAYADNLLVQSVVFGEWLALTANQAQTQMKRFEHVTVAHL